MVVAHVRPGEPLDPVIITARVYYTGNTICIFIDTFCSTCKSKQAHVTRRPLPAAQLFAPCEAFSESIRIYKQFRVRSVREASHKVNVNESTWVR
jgi:hypothetical protein